MPEALAVSIRDALRDATGRLAAAGCDTPRLDAEILLAFVLGCDRVEVVVGAHAGLDPPALERFEALTARRAAREPVAYIVGRKEFRWITLSVDRRVLIPRPETELLVEVGLTLAPGARVVDVGTGSGAVALALKHERPDLVVTGVDVRADALELARGNALALGLDVEFLQADLLDGVGDEFDAVLANLPYVPQEFPLPPEVALYEPSQALFAGGDGLDLVRRLLGTLPDSVSLVALEVGFEQAAAVGSLVRLPVVEVLRDLAGLERVVVGRR